MINQLQELMVIAGLDIVGPLPRELQTPIAFAAALMDSAKQVDAAQALVQFLRSPEAAAVTRSKGMLPAAP